MVIIAPRVYPLLGMFAGYLLVMLTSPVRISLRDGFRCVLRFKRLWLLFALLALAYSAFQFAVFTPLQPTSDLHFEQFAFWESWHWPAFAQIWRESLLHTIEASAGIFDAAATTYPLSVLAAILLIVNAGQAAYLLAATGVGEFSFHRAFAPDFRGGRYDRICF
jgi:hypothetical protein